MEPQQALDAATLAIFTLLKIIAPLMLTALAVGVSVSLLQALTQIQEATLTAVPKIAAVLLLLLMLLPSMGAQLGTLALQNFEAISAPSR